MTTTKTECPGCWDDDCPVCTDSSSWHGMPSQHHGVRTNLASSKQVDYLVKLGMDRSEAETLSKSEASDAIDRLRSTSKIRPATDKQVDYVKALMASRDLDIDTTENLEADLADGLTSSGASAWIDALRSFPYRSKDKASGKAELLDGMYKLDDQIYKVYHTVHGANQQVAKVLMVEPGGGSASFEYVGKRPLRDLTPEHKLSLEDAKAFGVVYGVCCVCGATLTDENSIRNGIGPVCASRF